MTGKVTFPRFLLGFVILAGFFFLSSHLSAVTFPLRWRWSNPTPHGGNVFSMAYGDGLTVQVCERGQICASDDLVTWTPYESGTTNSLRAVTFFGDRLVITGEKGTVVYADSLEDFHLVSLNTSDWLEGVAASPNLLIAVGDRGAVYTSTNGASWSRQTVTFTNWLRAVAYANNTFVAVGESGFIATRGASGTWTVRSSPTTRSLNKVAFIENQFRAVGEGGVSLVGNAVGQNWSLVSGIGTTNTFYALAGTNSTLLHVGEKEVRLQENSGTWSNQLAPNLSYPAPSWTYYDALWEGSLFFIAGRSGMMVEGFNTNAASGTEWVTRFDPIRNWLWDLIALTNLCVAVGDHATIMTSDDGVTWDLELVPNSATNTVFLGIGGSTNSLVTVGNRGTIAFSSNTLKNVIVTNADQTVVTNKASTLGVEWRSITPITTNDLQGVAFQGNRFVVCGGRGTILTSTNGTNWSLRSTPTTVYLSSVAANPNCWVATGDRGTVLTSTNGLTWAAQASGTTNWIYRVRYLNGRFVAVGENGTIMSSPNGTNWVIRSSGTTKWLNGVEFATNTYFVVGNQGTVLTSTNLTNWTNIGTITQKSLYGVAAANNRLLAAGIEGSILRCSLSPIMDPVKILKYSRASNTTITLVAGKTDQRFNIQHSTNLVNWATGPTLEIVDRSGTLLFLENADTNSLSKDFLRAETLP